MKIDATFTLSQPLLPTRKLWRALVTVYNHYLVEEIATLRSRTKDGEVPQQVADALRLLDCWIDTAIENGWVSDEL